MLHLIAALVVSASLMPPGKQAYVDANGAPLAGGRLYTYAAGTSTPLATYSDEAGVTPNTNPVILDARGEATVFWGPAPYKIVLRDANDVTVWTQDNVYARGRVTVTGGSVPRTLEDHLRTLPDVAWDAVTASSIRVVARGTTTLRGEDDRWSDTANVKDFGAIPDDGIDDTLALQAAINSAVTTGKDLYVPAGVYSYSALTVTLSGSNRHLHIRGATTSDISGTHGSILSCTASSADCITFEGSSGNLGVAITGITFKATATANNGIVINQGWKIDFTNCVFLGHSKAGAAAVKLTMTTGTFCGLATFDKCQWETNAVGVWELPTATNQINVVRYSNSRFLDSTEAAIKIGSPGLLMQGRSHSISHCDFEGNYRDVVAYGYVYGFAIDGATYFENNTPGSPPRVEMTSGAEALVIQGNFFGFDPGVGGTVIKLSSVDGATIRSNFSATGGSDRTFVEATVAGHMNVDPAQTAPGISTMPNRLSIGGTDQLLSYVDPVMWATTGSISWGAGSNPDGRVGDLRIRTDVSGSRGAIMVKRTANWRQIQNNDYSVLTASGVYITPNAALADVAVWTPPNSNTYTFLDPINPSEAQTLTIRVVNTTGGALGTITWTGGTAGYHLAGAWVNPANGYNRSITFLYYAATGAWYEISRSADDVAN